MSGGNRIWNERHGTGPMQVVPGAIRDSEPSAFCRGEFQTVPERRAELRARINALPPESSSRQLLEAALESEDPDA